MYSITSMKLILQLLLVGLINLHVKSAMVSCRQKNKHAAGVPFLFVGRNRVNGCGMYKRIGGDF